MTSLIAGSVARKLSVYFKNVTADTLSLSFLKGQALLPLLGLSRGIAVASDLLFSICDIFEATCIE